MTSPDLDIWNEQKKEIQEIKNLPSFKQGEIWWCSVGKNIGREAYGKGSSFTRPVYIFKKISKDMFLGIPLTSQEKIGTWWHRIETHDKIRYAILPQLRLFSAHRLRENILTVFPDEQEKIQKALIKYLIE